MDWKRLRIHSLETLKTNDDQAAFCSFWGGCSVKINVGEVDLKACTCTEVLIVKLGSSIQLLVNFSP